MESFITEWGKIAGLAGLALGVFLILFREVIRKNIFATLTKKQSYTIIILILVLVWSISVYSIYLYNNEGGPSGNSSQVTVLVHGEKGKDQLVLPNRGRVKLIYGDANVVETINNKGEATFKQVPPAFFEKDATVEILFTDPEGEPYRAKNPDSVYMLTKGKYISLEVKLFGLNNLRGVVRDFETGEPVDSVRVSILGLETFSNQYGEYTLDIPKEQQRKFQTVRALKKGYQPFELSKVPVQTDDELPISLKPKQK
ncbi:carboxypeptidase-like regulatory domain-containing protein [Aequorivita capsosiphonis]|uniref:carboxypeptidase-like regulatory domain-containing protein n=1 Tax=Aequorivita capsosiphonis TaxID=487317 RepID=UPI00041CF153|nr:carboxypeptidase-like regulatory domain-containing protein [Aequorivita capsosiphonis]